MMEQRTSFIQTISASGPNIPVNCNNDEALGELTEYYRINNSNANPEKTKVTAFHLWNRDSIAESSMEWDRS